MQIFFDKNDYIFRRKQHKLILRHLEVIFSLLIPDSTVVILTAIEEILSFQYLLTP